MKRCIYMYTYTMMAHSSNSDGFIVGVREVSSAFDDGDCDGSRTSAEMLECFVLAEVTGCMSLKSYMKMVVTNEVTYDCPFLASQLHVIVDSLRKVKLPFTVTFIVLLESTNCGSIPAMLFKSMPGHQ